LNLIGVILPGERTAAVGSRLIHLRDGAETAAAPDQTMRLA
jgi:hypothetical protein